MPGTRLILVRHGETDYNKADLVQGRGIDAPLNATGMAQAEAVGRWLDGYGYDAVVSSSMLRARQTAAIATGRPLDAVPHEAGLEEMAYGAYEGIPVDDTRGALDTLYAGWARGRLELAPPGGETPGMVLERALPVIGNWTRRHAGGRVLVVTHGRVLRILVAHLLGWELSRMQDVPHRNACIYILRQEGGGYAAELFCHTDHLNETSHS